MTIWRAPERTAAAQAIYGAAEADRVANPADYSLDPDTVAARAVGDRNSVDFAPGWRAGLEAYLASAAEDGHLNAVGTRMAAQTAVAKLRAGATLTARCRAEPEILDRPLLPPIVIVGGWRTGTTFLFRLLATDPRLRAPLPVELTAPHRIADLRGDDRERAIDAGAAAHEFLRTVNPQLRAIHDSGARLPEECVLALGTGLRSWGFTSTTRLDSYADWLATEDLSAEYERYRHQLQLLDHGDGRRWVLKAPAHVAELDHLTATFPGAVVVHLHRDIVETMASGASLFATFRTTYSDDVDGADVGRFQADQTERWFDRAVAFRSSPAASSATWLDVAYEDLIADTAGLLDRIWTTVGMDSLPDPDGFVATYHSAHPRGSHGAHRYTAEDFGLHADELRDRFANYESFVAEVTAS